MATNRESGSLESAHHSDMENADVVYFQTLSEKIGPLRERYRSEIVRHIDYLAGKSGTTIESILSGRAFRSEKQVLLDAQANIDAVLAEASASSQSHRSEVFQTKSVQEIIQLAEQTLQGWCSTEKATAITELVIAAKPLICVEIGVYGGRSLMPVAAALRGNGVGVIYGIETWHPGIATEHATNDTNDSWWKSIDFHSIKTGVYRFAFEQDLCSQVKIIEAPSAEAAALFSKIDYLHIDGAHSIYNAAEDVVLYSKKVSKGGLIVMDDVNWTTTAPAVAILDSLAERIKELHDDQGRVACIIFKKL